MVPSALVIEKLNRKYSHGASPSFSLSLRHDLLQGNLSHLFMLLENLIQLMRTISLARVRAGLTRLQKDDPELYDRLCAWYAGL